MTETKKAIVSIEFDNERAAECFIAWLSGVGEQDYWEWQREREARAQFGAITATTFTYEGLQVQATCGRLDAP